MRIFITGITGAGKTYLANKLKETKYSDHDLIEFDKHVNYSDTVARLVPIYNLINASDHFILDALPVLDGDDLNVFRRYLEKIFDGNTIVYIVHCSKEHWLERRVPIKQEHLMRLNNKHPSINEYSVWYDSFLQSVPYIIGRIQNYVQEVNVFDSVSNCEIDLEHYFNITRIANAE